MATKKDVSESYPGAPKEVLFGNAKKAKFTVEYRYQGKWIVFNRTDNKATADADCTMLGGRYDARIRVGASD